MVKRTNNPDTGESLFLRDSRYASKFYSLANGAIPWSKVPRPKFLFYARFVRPTPISNRINSTFFGDWIEGFSFQIKTVDKPKVRPVTESLKQYNKTRVVQTGVKYNTIHMTLHDTVDDTVLKMWRDYFHFYYGDGRDKNILSWLYDVNNAFKEPPDGWGFSPTLNRAEESSYYFSHLELYHFYGGLYNKINLIHPKISTFSQDKDDYSIGNKGAEITISLDYEGVVYEKVSTKITSEIASLLQIEDFADFFEPPITSQANLKELNDSIDNFDAIKDANRSSGLPILNQSLGETQSISTELISSQASSPLNFALNTGVNVGLTAALDFASGSSSADVLRRTAGSLTNSALSSFGNFNFGLGNQLIGTAINVGLSGGSLKDIATLGSQVGLTNVIRGVATGRIDTGSFIGVNSESPSTPVSGFLGVSSLPFDKGISSSQVDVATTFLQRKGVTTSLAQKMGTSIVKEAQQSGISVFDLLNNSPGESLTFGRTTTSSINALRSPTAQQGTNPFDQLTPKDKVLAKQALSRLFEQPVTGIVSGGTGGDRTKNAIRAEVGDSWPDVLST